MSNTNSTGLQQQLQPKQNFCQISSFFVLVTQQLKVTTTVRLWCLNTLDEFDRTRSNDMNNSCHNGGGQKHRLPYAIVCTCLLSLRVCSLFQLSFGMFDGILSTEVNSGKWISRLSLKRCVVRTCQDSRKDKNRISAGTSTQTLQVFEGTT